MESADFGGRMGRLIFVLTWRGLFIILRALQGDQCAEEYFGLKDRESRSIAAEIATVVSSWRSAAEKAGLTRAEIDRMASAFSHDDLKDATS